MKIKELDSICIIGPGLIGGSIGLALRGGGFSGRIIGVTSKPRDGRKAVLCGAIDESFRALAAIPPTRLFVIATPLAATPAVLRSLDILLQQAPAVVTDVGSTKREIVRVASRELSDPTCFLGGHPMAGSERCGVEFARADLFRGATTILTPTRGTHPAAVRIVAQMWRTAGASVTYMSPAEHDRAVATTSHLPHAVAATLMRHCAEHADLSLAGKGLLDITRIASGDAEMWTQILLSNRDHLASALRATARELDRLVASLRRGDGTTIRRVLARAAAVRDEWVARKYHRRDWTT